jgi:hypothetical protein
MSNQDFKNLLRSALFAATDGNRLNITDEELANVQGSGSRTALAGKLPTFNQTPEYSEFTEEFIQAKPPKLDNPLGGGILGEIDLDRIDLGNLGVLGR